MTGRLNRFSTLFYRRVLRRVRVQRITRELVRRQADAFALSAAFDSLRSRALLLRLRLEAR